MSAAPSLGRDQAPGAAPSARRGERSARPAPASSGAPPAPGAPAARRVGARERRYARGALAAVRLASLPGTLAFLAVLAELDARGAPHRTQRWAAGLGLVVLPLVARPWGRGPHDPRWRWLLALQLAPLLLPGAAVLELLALAPLVVIHGNLLARARDERHAGAALAVGAATTLAALAVAPSAPLAWLLVAQVPLASVALVLLSGLRTERELRARAPGVLARRRRPEPPARVGRRLRFAGLLAGALVAVGGLALAAVLALPDPARRGGAGVASEPLDPRREREEALGARRAFERIFPSELEYGRGVAPLEHEVVLELRPRPGPAAPDARDLAPLYLRGLVLDRFGPTEARFGGADGVRTVADADDGARDGWTRLATAPGEAELVLDVVQQPLLVRDGSWSVLFAPDLATAVALPEVLHSPAGLLALPSPPSSDFAWSMRWVERRAERLELAAGDAARVDERYLQLPPDAPELDWIAARARRITRGAADDLARVRAVLAHFEEGFAYSLAAGGPPGLEGVVAFLRRREGHCTAFASAAALLLRSVGVPCRVATGFAADRVDEDSGAFVVTTRDGHAWLEVPLEGLGWVTFDPTPRSRRAAALRAAEGGASGPGAGEWLAELAGDLEAWAASGAEPAYLGVLADTLAEGPAALWRSAARRPWLAALVGVLLVAPFLLRRLRPRANGGATRARGADPERGLAERLQRLLARRGYPRAPGQTLRAVASRAAAEPDLAELPAAVELLYRARFGGRPLAAAERRACEALLRAAAGRGA